MNKSLRILFLAMSLVSFSQTKKDNATEEIPFLIQKEKDGISKTGLYGNNLARIGLSKSLSLNFGPSYNETSLLNFYELPVLVELTHKKWQFYTGGQVNWMLDQDSLKLGNRFGSDIYGLSIPVGIKYNFNKQSFLEFKYNRNVTPNSIPPIFQAMPKIRSEFKFGAGYKF